MYGVLPSLWLESTICTSVHVCFGTVLFIRFLIFRTKPSGTIICVEAGVQVAPTMYMHREKMSTTGFRSTPTSRNGSSCLQQSSCIGNVAWTLSSHLQTGNRKFLSPPGITVVWKLLSWCIVEKQAYIECWKWRLYKVRWLIS